VIPVLNSKQMQAADRAAIASGVLSIELMENAAAALVSEIRSAYPDARRVAVVCGPGNNGGDGLAAARRLTAEGCSVSVLTLRAPEHYRGDAAENLARAREAGLEVRCVEGRLRGLARELASHDAVLDALFGTGLTRALEGDAARTVAAINASGKPVVAADLPSGLSADSGELLGPCVAADVTVAFAAAKHCHVLDPARSRCGRVLVEDIGISRETLDRQKTSLRMTEPVDVAAALPRRRPDAHKGDAGRVAIVAGSRGKTGAAILAARGALRAGGGLVTVFCAQSLELVIVAALTEAMTRGLAEDEGVLSAEAARPAAEALADFDAAAVGPGLGSGEGIVAVLRRILSSKLPLVCDADALNAFAGHPEAFRRRPATVLTPHPGEAARLLGTTTRVVQSNRLAAAQKLARAARAVVILKGAGSLIATPSGRVTVNPTGTPLMATAGSGDVLTGAVGALLAAGLDPETAAIAAAYLHGAAGERLEERFGDAGLLASELADAIPEVRKKLSAVSSQLSAKPDRERGRDPRADS
jgi:ADP-dependent NAD(P)H-hydrate dehydratase / NAD(P)H-hydrate epimerase